MAWMAEYLASVALRSLALAAVAGGLLWMLRVKSAAVKHAVWTLVTAAMMLMAVLEPLLPPVVLRVLRAQPAITIAPPEEPIEIPSTAAVPRTISTRTAAPSSAAPIAVPARRIVWQDIVAAVYLAGVVVSLAMLLWGYRVTCRMVRAGREIEWPGAVSVHESSWIAVPVTVGVWRPRILLPPGWREWLPEKLEAVMAHERAHVQRGDWAIAMLAAVNRSLLWFHPLAWWLERQLSALAEQSADDAVLLKMEARTSYAQTLLDMAAAVRADRGRMVREATAMAKTAEVRVRIERILDETRRIPRGLTRARWLALGVCAVPVMCLAAVVQLAPAASGLQLPMPAIPVRLAVSSVPALRSTPPASGLVFSASVTVPAEPAPAVETPAPQTPPTPFATFRDTVYASSQAPYPLRETMAMYGKQATWQRVEPVYPPEAMAAGIQGDVELNIVIGLDGRVKLAEPTSGDPILAAAAQQAVKQWTVAASSWSVGPVEIETTVVEQFRLPGSMPPGQSDVPPVFKVGGPVPQRLRFEGRPPGYAAPVLLYKKEPEYTLPKRAAGIAGTVILSVTIDVQGRSQNIQVTQSVDPMLDQNAIDAVSKWRFQPAKQDGESVESVANALVSFQLVKDTAAELSVNTQPGGKPLGIVPGGSNVPARLLSAAMPEFTNEARAAKWNGSLTVNVLVGSDGGIRKVRVPHTVGMGLDEAAMTAATGWQFEPATRNGRSVDSWTSVQLELGDHYLRFMVGRLFYADPKP